MPPSSQQAYASLQDYSKNRRSTQDIQREAESKYDVTGISSRLSKLRSLVGNLESSVEQVDPSVTSRLSGGFATEGQRSALVAREQAPILGNLAKQQSALGNENQNFGLASSMASELARSLRSDDETGYQRLLDQYNAATAQEQAAEAKRQFELQQAEQQRQFNEQLRASSKSSGGGGYDISSILSALGAGGGGKAPSIQDQAYTSVQNFLSKGKGAAESDYIATLKSANRGNAMDKLKVQLYNQQGIGKGGGGSGLKVGVATPSQTIRVPGATPSMLRVVNQ